MQFVKEHTSYIFEEKKSKFIAHLFPYSQFDTIMENLKKEHPKGRHFVYGYRYLNRFDQVVENSSDDGEPKGTSGKPSLAVLSGNQLINTGVIIVRYFGGIKLGTGGLVRAYSDSVNLVIQNSTLYRYIKLVRKLLNLNYADLSKIEYHISELEVAIIDKEFTTDVTLRLEGSSKEFEKLTKVLPRGYMIEDI